MYKILPLDIRTWTQENVSFDSQLAFSATRPSSNGLLSSWKRL